MPFLKQVTPLWERSPLTLAELAEMCGISESSASRYINGKVSPPADIAEKILQVLGGAAEPAETSKEVQIAQTSMTMHIREIYQAQIATLQENHNSQITTLQAHYKSQIADLKRDKLILGIIAAVLGGVLLYFVLDSLHGDWGLVRYALNSLGRTVI